MNIFNLIKQGKITVKKARKILEEENKKYTDKFVPVESAKDQAPLGYIRGIRSKDFFAQVYNQNGWIRISINRTALDNQGTRWKDGITWDQIQRIKNECGFADKCAVELYPPESEKVDVANIRHIFVLNEPPPFMWLNEEKGDKAV